MTTIGKRFKTAIVFILLAILMILLLPVVIPIWLYAIREFKMTLKEDYVMHGEGFDEDYKKVLDNMNTSGKMN